MYCAVPEPDSQQQHEDDRDPDEGGEEEEQQDLGAGQHEGLHRTVKCSQGGIASYLHSLFDSGMELKPQFHVSF